jgi:hypothetical protein
LVLERVPAMGSIEAFARVELADESSIRLGASAGAPPNVRVPLSLVPSERALADVSATWVDTEELPLLRRLLYALGPDTLRRAEIAVTPAGAFVRAPRGADILPLGRFHRAIDESTYLPAGFELSPEVSAPTLANALRAPAESVVILRTEGPAWVIPRAAFVSLEIAMLEGPSWTPLRTLSLDADDTADAAALTLVVEEPGARPMRDVEDAPAT